MALAGSDFELLLQANRILSSKLDIDDVLQAVMELATKVVRAEASSLLLLDEKTNELTFDVALGSARERVKKIRIKVGEGVAGWVAKEKLPLIVNDVSRDERFTGKVDQSTRFQTRSILAVPLLAKGKLVGVVEAINKENNDDFLDQDREAFEVFASQAAIAIENARLFTQVRQEKEKLNTVFAEMSDGVMLLNESGRVSILNEAGSRYLGISQQEALGKTFGPDIFQGFSKGYPAHSWEKFKGDVLTFELFRTGIKDFYMAVLLHRLRAGNKNTPGGYLVILHDVTEERREEKLKRNFLSLISHKLKTPLTVIMGYAPTLAMQTEGLASFQKKAIESISQQSEQLGGLVDKLLRFTIVESDDFKKTFKIQKIQPLVQEAVAHIEKVMADPAPAIEVEPSVAQAKDVNVDGDLMLEVLKNLLENAVKFNDKGTKTVHISAPPHSGKVVLRVADNGTGIPPEEVERVFQKFYQIENSFTGQVPGAGLGLAFCKKVMEAMGGAITIESQLGQGTEIFVTLPTS